MLTNNPDTGSLRVCVCMCVFIQAMLKKSICAGIKDKRQNDGRVKRSEMQSNVTD